MPSHAFTKIYTRPTRAQDFEIFVRPLFRYSGGRITECLYVPRDGKWESWYREDEWLAFMNWQAKRVFNPGWTIAKHLAHYHRAARSLLAAAAVMARAADRKSLRALLPLYAEYLKYFAAFEPFIWTPWAITYVLDDWFAGRLREEYPEWQKIYEALAVSSRPIQMQTLVERLLAWQIAGNPAGKLEQLTRQYGHLGGYSVNDKLWTAANLLQQINDFKDPVAALEKMRQDRQLAKKKARLALAQLKNDHDKTLARIAEAIHTYVWLRTERIDVYKKALITAGALFRRIEKEFHWPANWAGHLTIAETKDILSGGEPPTTKDMANRAHHQYVAHLTPRETKIISDPKEQAAFLRRMIGDGGVDKRGELFGKPTYAGVARGLARVILHVADVPTMRPGEVLIANMTHPDYMPAIHKAAAIVADEGGIVCHAAIISRELKIPCVIGTSDATRVFKTGDLVEVDAVRGVVRKVQ